MGAKKRDTIKQKHWQHLIIAICLGLAILPFIWLQLNYPAAIREPLLRSVLYSFTLAVPTIVSLIINWMLPVSLSLPSESVYLISFITYLAITYYVLHKHHHLDKDLQKLYRKKTLVTILLVALWFFTILTIIYYH
jgi:O-antigen/teichoic acid export membrane protein